MKTRSSIGYHESVALADTLAAFGGLAQQVRADTGFLWFLKKHEVGVTAADCYMELHRLVDELQAMGCTRQAAIDFLLRNNATAEQAVLYAIGAKR